MNGAPPVVAHCATPFLWEGGGSWIYQQIARLERWEPLVLTQEARHLEEYPVQRLISAEDFPPWKRLVNRVVRRATGEYPFYGDLLRDAGARLIHAHFGYQACRCLRAERQTGLPLLTTFYGADATSYARMPEWRRRYAELFERGALFLVEGGRLAQHVIDAGAPAQRVRVQHLGVDVAAIPFRERTPPAGPVRVLMCGHFREKKGFAPGVRALGRALARHAGLRLQLRLVGDGPERPAIEQAVDEAGLGDLTEFVGVVTYSSVLQQLDECDVILQPSRTAADGDSEGGAPVILLDAQAAGVPVVATTHADIPEYVRHAESGWLAEEGDEEALVDAIGHVLTAPEEWAAMGRAGRAHVEAEYDAGRQAGRLEAIYDELTATG